MPDSDFDQPIFSNKDSLTGVWNRRFLLDLSERLLSEARNTKRTLSLAFIDIDHMKSINDKYGHQAGDFVIKSVVGKINQVSGGSNDIGRFGGEEFLILLPNMDREEAFLRLEQIRTAIESMSIVVPTGVNQSITIDPVKVTISAGLASYPIDGQDIEVLVKEADMALYRAKSMGRNRVRLTFEDKMVPKTNHFGATQLERISQLAQAQKKSDAELIREAVNDLLLKYGVSDVESP
jgi:diguanylate cyclase (GGDEF)-like protein